MRLFETIEYQVISKDKPFEIRKYPETFLASTKTVYDSSLSSGFNNVFEYISGANEPKQKISMTVPVITNEAEDKLVTSFVVPKKFNSAVPNPSSDNVYIETLEEGTYIVIRFRGKWSKEQFDKQQQNLLDYVAKNDFKISGSKYILRYQPPFVPSVFRRNEIMYKVNQKE